MVREWAPQCNCTRGGAFGFHLGSFGKSRIWFRTTDYSLPPSLLFIDAVAVAGCVVDKTSRSSDNSSSNAAHKTTDGTNDWNLAAARRWFTRRKGEKQDRDYAAAASGGS